VRLAEPQLEAVATPREGVPLACATVHSSRQKHLLTFLIAFDTDLIVVKANNHVGTGSKNRRAYSIRSIWRLRRRCASVRAICKNSAAKGEL
jgi:hypothetical protein